jgi:hypothetical protein
MAAFNKFNSFVEAVAEKTHNLGSDTLKIALTNTAPAAANTTWNTTDHPAPAAVNGYPAGGETVTITASSQTGGTYSLVGNDRVFTAAGGNLGPFRYAILYNDTAASWPTPRRSLSISVRRS